MAGGFNPTRNQSEADAPLNSPNVGIVRGAGIALARGFQTMLPGPYHYEDQCGQIGRAPYYPAAVVSFNSNFSGDVPLHESPIIKLPEPWLRRAP